MKYAFFLDIDGTLWKWGNIPEINKTTIKKVRDMGHKVFINTGRAAAYVPESLTNEIGFDGIVCGMGSNVIINGKFILQKRLTDDEIEFIFNYFRGKDKWLVFEGEEKVLFYHEDIKKIEEKKGMGKDFYVNNEENLYYMEKKSDYIDVYNKTPITKMTISGYLPTKKEESELSERFCVVPHPEANYTEIGSFGYDKGAGMELACKAIGIDRAHCVAMGDSANDIGMLKKAGISVAMGNSVQEVKEMCDMVSIDCMEGGVAYAMEKIINKNA